MIVTLCINAIHGIHGAVVLLPFFNQLEIKLTLCMYTPQIPITASPTISVYHTKWTIHVKVYKLEDLHLQCVTVTVMDYIDTKRLSNVFFNNLRCWSWGTRYVTAIHLQIQYLAALSKKRHSNPV